MSSSTQDVGKLVAWMLLGKSTALWLDLRPTPQQQTHTGCKAWSHDWEIHRPRKNLPLLSCQIDTAENCPLNLYSSPPRLVQLSDLLRDVSLWIGWWLMKKFTAGQSAEGRWSEGSLWPQITVRPWGNLMWESEAGAWRQELKRSSQRNAIYWLASGLLSFLSYDKVQKYLLKESTAHRGLGTTASINNKDPPPHTHT